MTNPQTIDLSPTAPSLPRWKRAYQPVENHCGTTLPVERGCHSPMILLAAHDPERRATIFQQAVLHYEPLHPKPLWVVQKPKSHRGKLDGVALVKDTFSSPL